VILPEITSARVRAERRLDLDLRACAFFRRRERESRKLKTRWRSGTDSNFRYHEWDLLTPETTVASGQFFIRSWMDLFQESGWRQPGSGLEAANACSSIASATRIKAGAESYRSRMVAGTFSGKSSSFPLCEGAELSTGSHHFISFQIRPGPISPSQ
jgi:hypothetical protein